MSIAKVETYKDHDGQDHTRVTLACDGPGCEQQIDSYDETFGRDWTTVMGPADEGNEHFCSLRCHLRWAAVQEGGPPRLAVHPFPIDGFSNAADVEAHMRDLHRSTVGWRASLAELHEMHVGHHGDETRQAAIRHVHQPRPGTPRTRTTSDPFPLAEEAAALSELPTVGKWLAAGGPMREVGNWATDSQDGP